VCALLSSCGTLLNFVAGVSLLGVAAFILLQRRKQKRKNKVRKAHREEINANDGKAMLEKSGGLETSGRFEG
jgi:hypothetical protein